MWTSIFLFFHGWRQIYKIQQSERAFFTSASHFPATTYWACWLTHKTRFITFHFQYKPKSKRPILLYGPWAVCWLVGLPSSLFRPASAPLHTFQAKPWFVCNMAKYRLIQRGQQKWDQMRIWLHFTEPQKPWRVLGCNWQEWVCFSAQGSLQMWHFWNFPHSFMYFCLSLHA